MRIYNTILFGLTMTLSFHSLHAQNENKVSKIEKFILQTMEKNNIVGCAITYFDLEKDLLTKGFGKLKKKGDQIDKNTPFYIGSMTKSFTAFAILQLEEAGKLKLEDPVIKHLPQFRTKNKNLSDQITVLHLLNHNSGLTTLQGNRSQTNDYDEDDALVKVVDDYKNISLKYAPGKHFEYSNANYQILGLLVERLSNTSFENYVIEKILKPLKMNSSSFERTSSTAIPHRYFLGIPREYKKELARNKVATGGLYSSAIDLQKYLRAILKRDTSLVSVNSYKKIFDAGQVGLNKMGFAGWMKRLENVEGNEVAVFLHGGTNPGSHSFMAIIPELGTGIVVLINTQGTFGIKNTIPLCYGPSNIVLGKAPPKQLPVHFAIMYFVLWAFPLILVWKVYKQIRNPKRKSPKKFFATFIFAMAICYLFLKFIPNNLGGANLFAVMRYEPEIGILLLSSSILIMMVVLIDLINFKRTSSNIKA